MYGSVNIEYKGAHPIVFGATALGAGLGAVAGLSRGGLAGAAAGLFIGGTLGLLIGYLVESYIDRMIKESTIKRTVDT